jgi:transcriptional regulator with XRE-family HTH domain
MSRRKVDLAKIKKLRKAAGITLEEMAKRLGYESPNGYYYLERGRSKFHAETLANVADILGVSLEELFCERPSNN